MPASEQRVDNLLLTGAKAIEPEDVLQDLELAVAGLLAERRI